MSQPVFGQRALNAISGLVLCAAATLKVWGLQSGDTSLGQLLPLPEWMIYLLSVNEALLGLWLIVGRPSSFQRRVTLAVFLGFSVVALKLVLDGNRTCGCFGALAVSPWYTFAFDLSVVIATVVLGVQDRKIRREGQQLHWSAPGVSVATVTIASGVLLIAVADAHYRGRFPGTSGRLAGDIRSLVPNLHLMFSKTGVAPSVIPKPTEAESVEGFLEKVANANYQIPMAIGATELSRISGFTQRQNSESPFVVETIEGRVLMLLNLFDDDGTDYWQVIESGAPPSLMMKSVVDDVVARAWRIPPVSSVAIEQRPSMSLDRLYENFGLIKRRESRETQFVITNTSNTAVALEAPTVSCHCLVAGFEAGPPILQPGDRATVYVKAAIGTRNLRQSVHVSGVTVADDRRLSPVSFEVLGSQLQIYSLSPGRLDFGALQPDARVQRVVRLSELRHDQLHSVSVQTDLPVDWSVVRKKRPNGLHDFLVELNLDASRLKPGQIDDRIRLDTDNERASELIVPVSGKVPPKFSVSPGTLAFGSPSVNERVERHARLRVPAGKEWKVSETNRSDGFVVSVASVGDGVFDVTVALLAASPGTMDRLIDLKVSSGDAAESVRLHCVANVHQ